MQLFEKKVLSRRGERISLAQQIVGVRPSLTKKGGREVSVFNFVNDEYFIARLYLFAPPPPQELQTLSLSLSSH